MKTRRLLLNLGLLAGVLAGRMAWAQASAGLTASQLATPEEKRLRNVRQLTFGGSNAEAYFSADGKRLIFQSTRDNLQCDQIFTMNVDGTEQKMVSTGKGRTTCGYIFPHQDKILYSSTHLVSAECPPRPDYSKGYVWAVYPGFDIFTAKLDGSDLKQLTTTPGYDAEATISEDGKKIVFTSLRNGDLDIYTMDANGKHVKQLTYELGYDGGPFFSKDRKWIVYRAYHPKTEQEIAEYKELLKQNLIRPTTLEIWIMKADGSGKRQLTNLNAASFAPSFFPMGSGLFSQRTWAQRAGWGTSNCTRSMWTERGWSGSRITRGLMGSRCLVRMESNWFGFRIATGRRSGRRMCLSRIGFRDVAAMRRCRTALGWDGRPPQPAKSARSGDPGECVRPYVNLS